MKICINMMLGVTMQMMAESLVLGEKAGLDWNAMIECICDSTAGAPMIKAKKEMYLKRDFTPMCTAKTLEKDMNLALSLGAKHGVSLPVTALTRQNYAAMRSLGIEELDYSAILEVNERMNGI